MNISFTDKQEAYIRDLVASGNYKNASEVVREALRVHAQEHQHKLEWLRAEIQKGLEAKSTSFSMREFLDSKLETVIK